MLVEPRLLLQLDVDPFRAALPACTVIITTSKNMGSLPGSVLYAHNGAADGATSAHAHHVVATPLLVLQQHFALFERNCDAFSSFGKERGEFWCVELSIRQRICDCYTQILRSVSLFSSLSRISDFPSVLPPVDIFFSFLFRPGPF